jgi:transposase
MVYFPPGCPDLNPQEQVWKQTREAVGHLCDYRHISDLRRAFQTYLENTLFHVDWLAQYLPAAFYESVFI